MQEIVNTKASTKIQDDIELIDLLRVLFDGKWVIIYVTVFFSIIGVIYSLSLPNIYESKTLLDSTSSSQGTNSKLPTAGLSSLRNVTGINLNAREQSEHSMQAYAKLNTLSFFEKQILPNIYLPNLMALKSWDSRTNLLEYDDNIFDSTSNKWVRDFSYPKNQIPSAQESFKVFKKKHLDMDINDKNGFLTLTIKHQSPFIAADWAKLFIDEINSFYRKKDKEEAEKALDFLNARMKAVNIAETRQAISSLMLRETQKLTLIEANEFYVYEFIDPPAINEVKSEPYRALICIFAAIFGAIISALYLLVRRFISI